jgi:hypothetical protein
MYNLSGLQKATTIFDVVKFANNASSMNGTPFLINGIIIGIFIILTAMMLRRYEFDDSIMVSGFLCFILSIFLRAAMLISFITLIGFGAIAGFTLFYKVVLKR